MPKKWYNKCNFSLLEVLPRAMNGSQGKQYQYTPEVQGCIEFLRTIRGDLGVSYEELLRVTQVVYLTLLRCTGPILPVKIM